MIEPLQIITLALNLGNIFATLGVIAAVWRYTIRLENRITRVETILVHRRGRDDNS